MQHARCICTTCTAGQSAGGPSGAMSCLFSSSSMWKRKPSGAGQTSSSLQGVAHCHWSKDPRASRTHSLPKKRRANPSKFPVKAKNAPPYGAAWASSGTFSSSSESSSPRAVRSAAAAAANGKEHGSCFHAAGSRDRGSRALLMRGAKRLSPTQFFLHRASTGYTAGGVDSRNALNAEPRCPRKSSRHSCSPLAKGTAPEATAETALDSTASPRHTTSTSAPSTASAACLHRSSSSP
mmetsp:Transcript_30063/g.87559  ORF Transcript_30063/g.87559 Transcript_30063/m.87559 type:complete len:237 (-) Transcript_30063:53-763(-)